MTGVFVVLPMSAVSAVIHPSMMGMRTGPCDWAWGCLQFGVLRVAGLNRSLDYVAMMVTMIMHVTLSLSSLI